MNKKATLDVQTDNDFEKKLLAEVIPPGEVGIGFGDIGALDNVKSTLREVSFLAPFMPCMSAFTCLPCEHMAAVQFGESACGSCSRSRKPFPPFDMRCHPPRTWLGF